MYWAKMITAPLAARPTHSEWIPGRILMIGMPCAEAAGLHEARRGQHGEEAGEADDREPPVHPGEPLGVQRHAQDPRHDVVDDAPHREGDEAEQREVRVSDGPVREVDELVEAAQRLERALDADEQVRGGAGEGEAQRDRVYATRHDPRIVMKMFTTNAVTGMSSPIEQMTEMVLSHSGTGA